MTDIKDDANDGISGLQKDLNTKGLSRRKFLDRLKAAGIGFGAVGALGAEASARESVDKAVTLKSTNPAIDEIVQEGRENTTEGEGRTQLAQYFYRRFGGYRRFYRRGYRRFFYRRFYRRGYRRFFYRRFF